MISAPPRSLSTFPHLILPSFLFKSPFFRVAQQPWFFRFGDPHWFGS
jgi:hypothetical protein